MRALNAQESLSLIDAIHKASIRYLDACNDLASHAVTHECLASETCDKRTELGALALERATRTLALAGIVKDDPLLCNLKNILESAMGTNPPMRIARRLQDEIQATFLSTGKF